MSHDATRRSGLGVLMALSLLVSSGCAFATIKASPALVPDFPPQRVRQIVVGEFRSEKLADELRRRLVGEIVAKLRAEAVFPEVVDRLPPGARGPDTVIVDGQVVDFDEGSRLLQWFIGFGAGASSVTTVFHVHTPDGARVASFSAKRTYAGGLGIGGVSFVSMEDLMVRTAESVAETLARWRRGERVGDEELPAQEAAAALPTPAAPPAAPAGAAPALEQQLQRLDQLKTEGKISADEHALLRKRMIETFPVTQPMVGPSSPAPAPQVPASQTTAARPGPGAALRAPELLGLLGSWRGHLRVRTAMNRVDVDPAVLRIFEDRDQIRWTLTQTVVPGPHGRRGLSAGDIAASGTAAVDGGEIVLRGRYGSGAGVLSNTEIVYRLKRTGNTLTGGGIGVDNISQDLTVERTGG